MKKGLFNNFALSNRKIEKILIFFDKDIKKIIKILAAKENADYEQAVRISIFKSLSQNRKHKKKYRKV